MDQASLQTVAPVSSRPHLTMMDALAFFVIAVLVTLLSRAAARALFPGSHPRVRRAVVQVGLLAGLALGAYIGLHFIDSNSADSVQMSAHKAQ